MKSIFKTIINTSLFVGVLSIVNEPISIQAQTIEQNLEVTTLSKSVTSSAEIYDFAMSKYFLTMPDDVIPLLSTVNRADFIDFWASHMKAEVTNKLQGTSEMDMLSSDYLHIKIGNSSEVAIKLVPIKKDTVICMSYTVHAPLADSHIELYNLQWERLLTRQFIEEPKLTDFFIQPNDTVSATEKQKFRMAISPLIVYLRSIILSPNNSNLNYVLTSVKGLPKEEQKTMKPYLKDSIVIHLK